MLPKSRLTPIMALYLLPAVFLTACGGGGANSGPISPSASNWLIPVDEVIDGGPGKDGIPAIDAPRFQPISLNVDSDPDGLIVGVLLDGEAKAFPRDILNWHEIVNDRTGQTPMILNYCPLTGTGMAWYADPTATRQTFGVSGLLYNSNLILYDRETDSNWSQMLEMSVEGVRIGELAGRIQVLETTLATWELMYPNAKLMTRVTGHTRDYDDTPYRRYETDEYLLFPVSNEDNRLHRKERVLGIRSATSSRVYQVAGFGPTTQTINDNFEGMPIIVVGNSALKFGAIFERTLDDGTILNFTPRLGDLPNVMQDDEGNVWNIFGKAVSGPRAGTDLRMTQSYTAMWFAWATFFVNAEIYFN